MLWIEIKYANLLSIKLDKFKLKKHSPYLANCRCPYCGDSDYSKIKARGYIVEKGGKLLFFCHNCGKSTVFGKMLQEVDQSLYDEFRLEKFKELGGSSKPKVDEKPFKSDMSKFAKRRYENEDLLKSIKKISALPVGHPAKAYVEKRLIPHNQHFRLYYAPKFVEFVHKVQKDKLKHVKEHPRLIIPLIDEGGRLFGFQGRAFDKKDPMRYITIMLDEEQPKVFGLDQAKLSKDTFIVEGPLDSLFLPNCVAMAGSDVDPVRFMPDPKKAIFVYDNEPRSKVIVHKMQDRIDQGYRVVIFPEKAQSKDINDMILQKEFELEEISGMLYRNTVSGLEARLRMMEWSRI
ncbi:DNA primase [Stenotrophomonas phage vB_SmaS-DLP_6]|nr:DNA primase [Stenotrophomonas phage vB_SmaS-DLP_6]